MGSAPGRGWRPGSHSHRTEEAETAQATCAYAALANISVPLRISGAAADLAPRHLRAYVRMGPPNARTAPAGPHAVAGSLAGCSLSPTSRSPTSPYREQPPYRQQPPDRQQNSTHTKPWHSPCIPDVPRRTPAFRACERTCAIAHEGRARQCSAAVLLLCAIHTHAGSSPWLYYPDT